jgi:hypothetical protein
MKIAFIHDWEVNYEQELTWKDGLSAALKELSSRHEVRLWVEGKTANIIPHDYFPIHVSPTIPDNVEAWNPDVILFWADCTRPNAEPCSKIGKPMALCFAGGDTKSLNTHLFRHFFVESSVYLDRFTAQGNSASLAFGTNTYLFQPISSQHKIFDAIFPATFADWKRHNLWSAATEGMPACAVGYMYDTHEDYCWKQCQKAGNLTLPHVSAEALRHLYAASRTCVVTSKHTGGSQRTVLEAMAMNVPVIVMDDSDKTTEYVRKVGGIIVPPEPDKIREAINNVKHEITNTRDHILKNHSEKTYAAAIESVLTQL